MDKTVDKERSDMGESGLCQPTVVRTERGLTIAGTRITLYQILDYLKAQKPVEMIRDHFRLTIKQTEDVLAYIEQHHEEVEAEYQRILEQAEENREYWQQRNAERFAEIAARSHRPEHQAVWEKLSASQDYRV
ncbi:MAG: DUF433 domain-containing protein [Anaerolineales bacterium]